MIFSSSNYLTCAFIKQGVAILSTLLMSQKVIDVNIAISQVFVLVRQHIAYHGDLKIEIRELEMNRKFKAVYKALHNLLSVKLKPISIGLKQGGRIKIN